MFQDKDYLDYRYFYKKAYYLAFIACALSDDDVTGFTIEYALDHGSTLCPVILVRDRRWTVSHAPQIEC